MFNYPALTLHLPHWHLLPSRPVQPRNGLSHRSLCCSGIFALRSVPAADRASDRANVRLATGVRPTDPAVFSWVFYPGDSPMPRRRGVVSGVGWLKTSTGRSSGTDLSHPCCEASCTAPGCGWQTKPAGSAPSATVMTQHVLVDSAQPPSRPAPQPCMA